MKKSDTNHQNHLFTGHAHEYIRLAEIDASNCHLLKEPLKDGLTILWFTEPDNHIIIDGQSFQFDQNQLVCLTEFHKFEIKKINGLRKVRFNREFYCILDHDTQIGCKGILFFGASDLPIFNIPDEELKKFTILWEAFILEFESKDELQIEMLQMMLKRFLILCARLYKEQHIKNTDEKGTVDLIREFNFLVESHFKTKHTVADYAYLLYKSPKTLSNYFAKHFDKSPNQIIRDRRMIEARRLLHYSDLPVKEVAYELGFENIQSFSRFFKANEGMSPSEFAKGKN